MSVTTYPIEYYQVNIGVGDCEIILLLEDKSTRSPPVDVLRAVLIDAGKVAGRLTNVRETMRSIEKRWVIEKLKFDAIVITHWDSDHYAGVVSLLQEDADAQIAADPAGTNDIRISFLKYDQAGNPLSTLYLAQEVVPGIKKIPQKLGLVYEDTAGVRVLSLGQPIPGKEQGPLMPSPRKRNLCLVMADMDIMDTTLVNGQPLQLGAPHPSRLIGRELFYGERVDAARTARSPQEIIDIYKNQGNTYKGDRPGLFCVAANNRYLPCGAVARAAEVHSPTNRSSIICLIVRPSGAVSHYLAGDAEADLEAGIVLWTGLQPVPARTTAKPNINETVPLVKASHHGAPSSTPLNLLQTFKPSVIMCSSGNMHKHPSWNFLLYVYSYLVSWRGQHAVLKDHGLYYRPFFLTCFPYYLNVIDEILASQLVGSDNPLVPSRQNDWCDTITAFFDPANFPHENELDLVGLFDSEDPPITTLQAQAEWLRDVIEGIVLGRFCVLHDTALPEVRTVDIRRPKYTRHYTPYSPLTQVLFVRVFSDDETQGPSVEYLGTWPLALPPSTAMDVEDPDEDDGSPPKKKRRTDVTSSSLEERALLFASSARALAATTDDKNKRFYIMSSIVEANDTSRSMQVGDEWDAFVAALTPGFITLSDSLKEQSSTVSLDSCDEWLAWFVSALSPAAKNTAVQVSVNAALKDSKVSIDHFEVTVPLSLSSSGKQLSLLFSPSRKVGYNTDTVFDPLNHFLRFDLSTTSTETISLADLLTFSNLPSDTINFGSDLLLTLDNKNSAVWFSPVKGNYEGAFRIQAEAQSGDWKETKSALQDLLKPVGLDNATPTSIVVIVKRNMSKLTSGDGIRCEKAPVIGLSLNWSDFTGVVFCGEENYTFALRWPKGALSALKDLLKTIGGSDLLSSFEEALEQVTKVVDILQVSVQIARGKSGPKVTMVAVDAQVTLNLGSSDKDSKDVIFMLHFVWPRLLFRGTLYTPDQPDQSWRKLMPYYEEQLEVVPKIDPSKIRKTLSILDLIPGEPIKSTPLGIPTEVANAMIEVTGSSISFSAFLVSVNPPDGDIKSVPPITFDSLELATDYNWKSKAFSVTIAATVKLHPKTNPDEEPEWNDSTGFLFASIGYVKGQGWTLKGSLENLNFGDLYTFFHPDEQSQVKDVLGAITIKGVDLTYQYNTDGQPNSFNFAGDIVIADVEFVFQFSHDGSGWAVKAALGAASDVTLGDMITSICGDDSQSFELPDFIGDIKLSIPHDGDVPTNWADSPIYLSCNKPSIPGSPLVFVLRITLGKLHLTFIQLSYPKQKGGGMAQALRPKRVLMFSFTHVLPSLTVPVVGKLDNPVDGLQFLWVQDGNQGTNPGLTRAEVNKINAGAFPDTKELLFKATKTTSVDTDVVLASGCHFMLLAKDSNTVTVALDYKFGGKNKQKKTTERVIAAKDSQPVKDSDPGSGGASSAPVHKTIGPLSFANIGLQFKDGMLFVVFDATLALGPVGLSLLGFGIGAHITSDFFTDLDVTGTRFALQLRGLAAALDKPPILLAGMFQDLSTDKMELFAGGVAISLNAYSFLALGSYGVVQDDSKKSFKTFFVFAQLRGPLVELEFATINGVTLGFGYNSHLNYPTADNILSFPLVKGISSESSDEASRTSDVLKVLSDDVFKIWVKPQDGSLWFAAGMEVMAFETLDVRAVAVIQIDPNISIGLFADAVCSVPPRQPRERCFVYVELGITCRVDIPNGTLAVDGMLSPNSFVLHPSCHLRGGFATYYWFNPSPYAGDFVFTVGGYHPAYKPPTYYPRPERLSISWKLDSSIGITGEAYFAVTPKVCMGGGSLSIVFSAGPFSAHLNAHADFLMVWNPFHFVGDIGVIVGASFKAKIWFVHVDISADIGATLHLEGPPFGGKVHVDLFLHAFDIYFGSHPGPPPPLSLDEFWTLLAQSKNQPDSGKDIGVTLVVQEGYAPESNKNVTPAPDTPWLVTGGRFKFVIQCRFAVRTVQNKGDGDEQWTDVVTGTVPVYAKPMHLTSQVGSVVQVKITKRSTSVVESGFTFLPLLKNVPSAQWGLYVDSEDPTKHPASDSMLQGSGSTLNGMLMGTMVTAPLPAYPDDQIPPFNAHDYMYLDVIKNESFPDDEPSSDAGAWLPKATTWDGAAGAWSSPPQDPQKTVDALASAFKWTEKLVGKAPELLLTNFKRVYLDIPQLTTA